MIEIKNVNKTYLMGDSEVHALQDVSLAIEPGEFVAIMGPSGSGKSTLLHVLGFLDKPDLGSYKIFDKDITNLKDNELAVLRSHLAGFVFQQFDLLPRISALKNVELPLIYSGKRDCKSEATKCICDVGLEKRINHRPMELSGGEQQKIAIARSLANEPLIIFADEPTGNLDSQNEKEIIAILKELNDKGKTIILVTHEMEVAREAKRIITMRDGRIVSDENTSEVEPSTALSQSSMFVNDVLSGRNESMGQSKFFDQIIQSYVSIATNKTRSFLSVLGILIGVGSVIAMMSIGAGASESLAESLRSMGTNLLIVRSGPRSSRGVAVDASSITTLTEDDAAAINKLREVKRVSAAVGKRVQVVHERNNHNTTLQGQYSAYQYMRMAEPVKGRFFTESEVLSRRKVAVIGKTVAEALFERRNPIGKEIKINRIAFHVIGVLPEKGAGRHGRDNDDIIIVPTTTAMHRLFGTKDIGWIDVEVRNGAFINKAEEDIKKLLMRRHRLSEDKKDSFSIFNMGELQEILNDMAKNMSLFLSLIAGISLFVGGIGIMNIMLVSVTERTREIGLRKALGAKSSDILSQFLVESVVLTCGGGLIGVGAGIGIAAIATKLAEWPFKVTMFSIVLAFGVSITIGLVFGIFPAWKAAKLNPIQALRHE